MEDSQQDCKNFKARKKNLGGGLMRVWFRFTRSLLTCDPGDYSVEDGTTHIVWSVGAGPLHSVAGVNVSDAEHGMSRVRLITVPPPHLTPDTRQLRIRAVNVSLPGQDTMYWCSVHRLPPQLVRKHHMVRYEADIQAGNEDVVHHMEVFHCPKTVSGGPFPVWSGSCDAEDAPPQLSQCKKVLAAWAIGAGPFSYPSEAGLAIGGPEFHPYVMLEVHYNNPSLRSGVVDSSGIRMHVTPQLRKYDAGIMELGLIYNNWMAIPPLMTQFTLAGVCTEECTGEGLARAGVTVFGSQLHTHGAGRRVETVLVRSGVETLVNQDKHYSTHFQVVNTVQCAVYHVPSYLAYTLYFQEIRSLARPVRVMPGDALVTRCYYDTSDRDNVTLGGFSFTEEMCVNYVHYYPRVDLEVCKSSIAKDDLDKYFETLKTYEDQDTDAGKSIEDNYNCIKWTKKRSHELSELYSKSHVALQCKNGKGNSLPGSWDKLKQPEIRKYIEEKDPCDCSNDNENNKSFEDNEIVEDNVALSEDLREKKFSLNSFEDQWTDYDSWGFDKRSDETINYLNLNFDEKLKIKRKMDHVHMGKRKLGSM